MIYYTTLHCTGHLPQSTWFVKSSLACSFVDIDLEISLSSSVQLSSIEWAGHGIA